MVRNANAPVFTTAFYNKTLSDNYPVATEILTVTATDVDKDALRYELVGDTTVLNLFFVEASTGKLFLKKQLKGRSETKYEVRAIKMFLFITDDLKEVFNSFSWVMLSRQNRIYNFGIFVYRV